jgi:hypothetical protein
MSKDLPEILNFQQAIEYIAKELNLSLKEAEEFAIKCIKLGALKGHVLRDNKLKRISIDEQDNINVLNS